MKKYLFITILGLMFWGGQAHAAKFYINSECNTPGNGTTTTCDGDADDSYDNIDDFAEVARNAGDIAVMRRVASGSQNGTDIIPSSDGDFGNPITIEADYDNAWGDFASSSQTYTVTRGSKQMTANASITGISAGDWIYVEGDNTRKREFAYEVRSVSGTVLVLYLPYKGDVLGSGKTLNIMPDNPIWNTATGDFQWDFDTDNYWRIQGLDIRGTDVNGNMEITSAGIIEVLDCIFTGNGSGDSGVATTGTSSWVVITKSRGLNHQDGFIEQPSTASGRAYLYDVFVDNDGNTSAYAFRGIGGGSIYVYNAEIIDTGNLLGTNAAGNNINSNEEFIRNLTYSGITDLVDFSFSQTVIPQNIFVEDLQGLGNNFQYGFARDALSFIAKDTGTVRSGGGVSSIKVNPPPQLDDLSRFFSIKLFEYPIYLDTSQTTFTVFFKPDNTASWSADPTASQLWVEIDVLASASGAFRYTKKSTAVIDMNGSSDWQSIPLTVIASQSGNAYLRAWYGKPQESLGTTTTDANQFYVDTKIDITQP